jgi:hypothetical protein
MQDVFADPHCAIVIKFNWCSPSWLLCLHIANADRILDATEVHFCSADIKDLQENETARLNPRSCTDMQQASGHLKG